MRFCVYSERESRRLLRDYVLERGGAAVWASIHIIRDNHHVRARLRQRAVEAGFIGAEEAAAQEAAEEADREGA